MIDKNSYYRAEIRSLFIKYNVAQNEQLLNELAQIVGSKDRAIRGASDAVSQFVATYSDEAWMENIEISDLVNLDQQVYKIFWQQSLEN